MRRLIEFVRAQFALDAEGIHGIAHWVRVRSTGLRLADETGARADVVELFAWLHDSRRRDDGHDPDHGLRAVELATECRGRLFQLDDEGFELLCHAMEHHTHGRVDGPLTAQVCWDADRLDLSRLGIRPRRELLCTDPARRVETIERAWRSGQAWAAWRRSRRRR
jgi:uncharacterized protein